jgi:WD40-like Beta Propeller Repeat
MNDNVVTRGNGSRRKRMALLLVLALLFSSVLPMSSAVRAPAVASDGVIAYVRADSGDEIRMIEPNGSNDRLLWSHGQADPQDVYEVWDLAWRPDGAELAFASDHENICSILHSDLYVIGSDGSGYRRITQGPACAMLASYPQGTVRVPVENSSIYESVIAFLYFQGAPGVQQVSLPPGGNTVVTFENVADFGDGWLQTVMEIQGEERALHVEAAVDVQAGATVETETVFMPGGPIPGWEVRSPSWRYDSGQLAFATGFNNVRYIAPSPEPLEFGDPLLPIGGGRPDIILRAKWGPTAARGNQLLYEGYEAFVSEGIYLINEGNSGTGEQLVSFPDYETVQGLAWLPDGTGFVYSVVETEFYEPVSANLFLYTFGSGQATRITNFDGSYAGDLSVSPDGQQIAFERSASLGGLESGATDLWLVDRDGSGLQLLVENAGVPAWGPESLLPPPPGENMIFLPLLIRNGP